MIYYGCPACSAAMASPESLAGDFDNCPICGRLVAVPGLAARSLRSANPADEFQCRRCHAGSLRVEAGSGPVARLAACFVSICVLGSIALAGLRAPAPFNVILPGFAVLIFVGVSWSIS
ncbi:MAG TPA: hypothetical protein VMW52_09380, partial [Phycisphaerae bacterium]|nr:hypothetical protein [Phycisphaerae bacterium]